MLLMTMHRLPVPPAQSGCGRSDAAYPTFEAAHRAEYPRTALVYHVMPLNLFLIFSCFIGAGPQPGERIEPPNSCNAAASQVESWISFVVSSFNPGIRDE